MTRRRKKLRRLYLSPLMTIWHEAEYGDKTQIAQLVNHQFELMSRSSNWFINEDACREAMRHAMISNFWEHWAASNKAEKLAFRDFVQPALRQEELKREQLAQSNKLREN